MYNPNKFKNIAIITVCFFMGIWLAYNTWYMFIDSKIPRNSVKIYPAFPKGSITISLPSDIPPHPDIATEVIIEACKLGYLDSEILTDIFKNILKISQNKDKIKETIVYGCTGLYEEGGYAD